MAQGEAPRGRRKLQDVRGRGEAADTGLLRPSLYRGGPWVHRRLIRMSRVCDNQLSPEQLRGGDSTGAEKREGCPVLPRPSLPAAVLASRAGAWEARQAAAAGGRGSAVRVRREAGGTDVM